MSAGSFDESEIVPLRARAAWRDCERQIKAFEDAWRGGNASAIEDFLIADGADRFALLVELVHIDLELRFKFGREVRAETYLSRFPELNQEAKVVVELLAAECILRQRHGGRVNMEDIQVHFPNHAEAVASQVRRDMPSKLGHKQLSVNAPKAAPLSVPGYEILAELGHGGMGVVYQARDVLLDRLVALKFLPTTYSSDPDRLSRFAREARTASALNHPHICTIHALGEHDSRKFIVMEFIEGATLESMAGQRVALAQLMEWIGQAARALAVAHTAGVVHRDIKPANIMVRTDGYVKVLDFGMARRLPALAQDSLSNEPDTDPGVFLGTAAYASPEQARGEPVSSASDIFSLGIVLYELATGRHPFGADSALGMLRSIISHSPTPPERINPSIPATLNGLIEAMLSKEPQRRPTAAEVASALSGPAGNSPQHPPVAASQRLIIHRDKELALLNSSFASADAGRGSFVCILGEPGIGKTTLVEDFLDEWATSTSAPMVIRGSCSERLAETETYLPVIDGLGDLLRADHTTAVARLLRQTAPTWYAQVQPNSEISGQDSEIRHFSTSSPANSQQAVVRDFTNFLREVGQLGPVVLFFDDVHWADVATVNLLAYLGRHVQNLRLLVIVTCRPTELLLGPHPFHHVQLELQHKGIATELQLGLLRRSQVDRYLSLAFVDHAFPQEFVELIFSQTEGSPLFMAELLRYLRERGVIAEADGKWLLASDTPDLRQDLPASVRGIIQRMLERLGEDDQRLLSAASVQGHEFDSALVANVLDQDPVSVEERLQVLERVHGLVRLVREHEFPDRMLTLRYAFVHILYQQALHANLSTTRRAKLSLALAEALASHQRQGSQIAAAELACLYEAGRDFARAAHFLWVAAQNAARLCADRESVVLAKRGLRQLENVAESPQRSELELSLQMTLGMQLQVTQGYAAPSAHKSYTRARKICEQIGKAPPFPVLWGLWLYAKVRSQLDRARDLADELRAWSLQVNDPSLALQAQQAQTVTALCRGEPAAALRNMEHGALLYDPQQHRGNSAQYGQDPDVACRAFGAVALWLLGYPEQALHMSDDAIARGHELQHPSTEALALHFAAMLHQLRRDASRTRACSDASNAIAAEHGLSFWTAGAAVFCGWALAEQGDSHGITRLRSGLADWQATGSVTYQTYYLGLLAEALSKHGAVADALRTVDEALALTLRTGEGLYLAELHRLRGEFLLANAESQPLDEALSDSIEQEFRAAIDIAQRQEANILKLRAALSLARFCRGRHNAAEARTLLLRAYSSFSEGLDIPDLSEVCHFLEGVVGD